jgi:hypothetical protein
LDLVKETEQVFKRVECAQLCADGASELADAAAALEENSCDEASQACMRARSYYDRAEAVYTHKHHDDANLLDLMREICAMEERIQMMCTQQDARSEAWKCIRLAHQAIEAADVEGTRSNIAHVHHALTMFDDEDGQVADALSKCEILLQNMLQRAEEGRIMDAARALIESAKVALGAKDFEQADEHVRDAVECLVGIMNMPVSELQDEIAHVQEGVRRGVAQKEAKAGLMRAESYLSLEKYEEARVEALAAKQTLLAGRQGDLPGRLTPAGNADDENHVDIDGDVHVQKEIDDMLVRISAAEDVAKQRKDVAEMVARVEELADAGEYAAALETVQVSYD